MRLFCRQHPFSGGGGGFREAVSMSLSVQGGYRQDSRIFETARLHLNGIFWGPRGTKLAPVRDFGGIHWELCFVWNGNREDFECLHA